MKNRDAAHELRSDQIKKDIIIVGAGAIGRGFLPWKINLENYRLIFVDVNRKIIDNMNKNGGYSTFRIKNNSLEEKFVAIDRAYSLSEFSERCYDKPLAVFLSVGPRNVIDAAKYLKGIECPLILCENDPKTVDLVKAALNYDQVYFAVPDVITSDTASEKNLESDPLAIHTENGELFVDERAGFINDDIHYLTEKELLERQWTAKLFLHNTSHCVTSYLGALCGLTYIHEVMMYEDLRNIVNGAMEEMLVILKKQGLIESDYLDWYAKKELSRFSETLLCDPISRVARDPYRKLELDGRLIGGACMCFSEGESFDNIMVGIVCASICASHDNINLSEIDFNFARENILDVFSTIGLEKTNVYDPIMSKLDETIRKVKNVKHSFEQRKNLKS